MKKLFLLFFPVILVSSVAAQPASGILQDLRNLQQMGSVLLVAAHPDDENTQLLAHFAHGRGFRTAYLSITRGEGGQNLIGPELGDYLGVIRTHELLAARRIDGARQFFTRARDFGYSKNFEEALQIWGREQTLGDVVRIIRTFKPDVIITRFSPEPGGTHGHHTASAVLALEAFRLAGDPNSFPDQLDELEPWQPIRIVWNAFRRGESEPLPPGETVRMNVGGYSPILGQSYGELAARSRTQHKSQGFGSVASRESRYEYFQLLDGQPFVDDLFDGIDTTWSRIPNGAAIGDRIAAIIEDFNPLDPSSSIPALLELRKAMSGMNDNYLIPERLQILDRIITASLGLYVESTVPSPEAVPGEEIALQHTTIVRSRHPVRWTSVTYPLTGETVDVGLDLTPFSVSSKSARTTLPPDTPVTHPFWLVERGSEGSNVVADPSLLTLPVNPPAFPVVFTFEVGGQTLTIENEPVQVSRDPVEGEFRLPLHVVSPVTLSFERDVELFHPGEVRDVTVKIVPARDDVEGSVSLTLPPGWTAVPEKHEFNDTRAGMPIELVFTITPPTQTSRAEIKPVATIDGIRFGNDRVEINYDHIPRLLLQPQAKLIAVSTDLKIDGQRIGYVHGAGDLVPESLTQMGYQVTLLTGAALTPARLKEFDAIVFGVRAFNTRTDLESRMDNLFDYVENGGTVIIQYNTAGDLQIDRFTPFDLTLSRDRVTDESSPVTILQPDHPAMNYPNRISEADFEGWIQERGLYFPSRWDDGFVPLLSTHDPGESPLDGGLLVAKYGDGHFVYTGYSWFRQLPHGVPGAYRLFANLLSL